MVHLIPLRTAQIRYELSISLPFLICNSSVALRGGVLSAVFILVSLNERLCEQRNSFILLFPWCLFSQADKFQMYVTYCKNKPDSNQLILEHAGTFFDVSSHCHFPSARIVQLKHLLFTSEQWVPFCALAFGFFIPWQLSHAVKPDSVWKLWCDVWSSSVWQVIFNGDAHSYGNLCAFFRPSPF